MSDLTRAMLDDFLPPGPVWEPEELAEFDLLLEGIADNMEVVRVFLSTLSEIRNPNLTIILADLEREYGIPTNLLLSESTRRTRLAELVFGVDGNGTEDDLQTALRNAGFDVFVYQNDPAVDPAIFLEQDFQMVAGGGNAFAGRADAFAGKVGGMPRVQLRLDQDPSVRNEAITRRYFEQLSGLPVDWMEIDPPANLFKLADLVP